MDAHPIRPRQHARLLPGDFHAGRFAQAEYFADLVDRIDARRVAELIEIGIARNLDRIRESKLSMRTALFGDMTLEKMVAVTHAATAIVTGIAEAFFQSRQRGHQF